jgi:hypothetical protein
MLPEVRQCRFDVRGKMTAHAHLVNAMRAGRAVRPGKGCGETRVQR